MTTKGNAMNKDQVSGTLKAAVGKAQARAGKAVHSTGLEAKGNLKLVEGRVQKANGDLRQALKNSRHS
jgi:uncharacterized protein YjbJ (UPF0337 family)